VAAISPPGIAPLSAKLNSKVNVPLGGRFEDRPVVVRSAPLGYPVKVPLLPSASPSGSLPSEPSKLCSDRNEPLGVSSNSVPQPDCLKM